jgi:hypothetical protein
MPVAFTFEIENKITQSASASNSSYSGGIGKGIT